MCKLNFTNIYLCVYLFWLDADHSNTSCFMCTCTSSKGSGMCRLTGAFVARICDKNKVRKRAKIRNRYNQAPHLTQDTNGKVTTSQLDITNESQEASPFPASDHKASINRCAHESTIVSKAHFIYLSVRPWLFWLLTNFCYASLGLVVFMGHGKVQRFLQNSIASKLFYPVVLNHLNNYG